MTGAVAAVAPQQQQQQQQQQQGVPKGSRAAIPGTVSIEAAAGGAGAPAAADRVLRATRALKLQDWDAAARLLTAEAEAQGPAGLEAYMVFDLRAAAHLGAGRYEQALDDAMHCTKLNPEWPRGWARLGAAQLSLHHPRPALSAYQRGLQLAPGDQEMQAGAERAAAALAARGDRRKAQRH